VEVCILVLGYHAYIVHDIYIITISNANVTKNHLNPLKTIYFLEET